MMSTALKSQPHSVLHLDLWHILECYKPADETERDAREQMLALLHQEPRAFDRRTFNPGHFTASVFLVNPEQDAVALIFHQKLQRWLQPGGHVEPEDLSLLAAAKRELLEECGVEAVGSYGTQTAGIFDLDIHRIPSRGSEPEHSHYDIRFALRAHNHDVLVGDGVSDVKWFALSNVDALQSDASVARAIRKLRSGC